MGRLESDMRQVKLSDNIRYKNIYTALKKKEGRGMTRTELIEAPKRMLFGYPKIPASSAREYKSEIPRMYVSTPLYAVKKKAASSTIASTPHSLKQYNFEMPRVETPYKKLLELQSLKGGNATERSKYDLIEEFIKEDTARSRIIYSMP